MNDSNIGWAGCSVTRAHSVDVDETSTWPADFSDLIARLARGISRPGAPPRRLYVRGAR